MWPLIMVEANSGAAPVCGEDASGVTPVRDMAASVSGRLFLVSPLIMAGANSGDVSTYLWRRCLWCDPCS